MSSEAPEYTGYGVPYWHSRGDKLLTPSGPEGSSGSSGFGRRDVAGTECRLILTLGALPKPMSYKVLARKWRPQHFRDMIGQEPVLRALVNALDTDRLHHAYLFTGMRGVGKTTIARIFAKCLNCEKNGVSSGPCGECSACQDIEAGRFFDLIEVDAASRTKVEETRELLENVPYAPSSGRYKVYLIDEVHMFSNHSFNALLKTLEEPPEHVKFLLATTDPQKVPVTVLSRCLQFNLKRMAPAVLADYLQKILAEESIECDRAALDLIARASEGSVRDSLSLVEQAAAFGEGAVREVDVESMLGRASVDRLLGVIESLGAGQISELFDRVEKLAEYAPDFSELLGEILTLLHKIAMLQTIPGSVDEKSPGLDRMVKIAESLAADELQLFYQIGLHARRDMPFAPDAREAFDMALLRMNAFKPQGELSVEPSTQATRSHPDLGKPSAKQTPVNVTQEPSVASTGSSASPGAAGASLPVRGEVSAGGSLRAAALAAARGEAPPVESPKVEADDAVGVQSNQENPTPAQSAPTDAFQAKAVPVQVAQVQADHAQAVPAQSSAKQVTLDSPAMVVKPILPPINKSAVQKSDWHQLVSELDISGMPRQLASHTLWLSMNGDVIQLQLESSSEHLNTPRFAERVTAALSSWFEKDIRLQIELCDGELNTPARIDEQIKNDEMAAARESIDQDPVIRQLIDRVDGAVDQASIQPVGEHQ